MQTTLDQLAQALDAARSGQLSAAQLVAHWRTALAAEAALPPRYVAVAEKVLSQLESGALFAEESCSFSQADVLDALADWLGHARKLA